nr:hypothetical protein [uncultured Carboxylicivirga sp.]
MISVFNYTIIKMAYIKKGYRFYDNGKPYNVNIFGIRNDILTPDAFDDVIGVAYRDEFNQTHVLVFPATTDPGVKYLGDTLGHPKGTFVLAPGQYKKAWTLDFHKGRYEALVQSPSAKFVGYRDDNRDFQLNPTDKLFSDVTGLNCHTTSFVNDVEKVGAYSAGCQVIQHSLDFQIFLSVVKKSSKLYGNSFTYTLFDEFDLY